MIFWVPQSGRLALGLSVLTYRGFATLGVACDAGLVPDPELLVQSFEDELKHIMRTRSCEPNTPARGVPRS
jgi:hypothetical protein